jgi:hypothetical protein
MFGMMVLGSLRIAHPATMNKYVFEPITPAHLIDNDSNIEQLPPVVGQTTCAPAERTTVPGLRAAYQLCRGPQP